MQDSFTATGAELQPFHFCRKASNTGIAKAVALNHPLKG